MLFVGDACFPALAVNEKTSPPRSKTNKEQIQLPVTSHRAYYRTRVNPRDAESIPLGPISPRVNAARLLPRCAKGVKSVAKAPGVKDFSTC